MTIIELARLTEDEARTYLEGIRWPNGPVCPHCGSDACTRMQGKAHRKGAIQCNACREQFTVTVGSIMERTRIPLVKWVMAFHLLCSSKKGFSALQLQRELGLGSYKSAWFLLHRIRHAMESGSMEQPLSGEVEVDETYVGARRPRYKGTSKRGRGTSKQPVVVLVERDGQARSKPIARVDGDNLKSEIREHVARESTIVTDEWSAYAGIGAEFEGGHHTVIHSQKEYARRDERTGLKVHTNTAESFFALIKRGHYGVYHQMSKKHLHRYCAEYEFRWNHRKVSDFVRMEAVIRQVGGKRLLYETPDRHPD